MANKKLVTYEQLNTLAKGIYNKLHAEVGTAASGVLQNKNDIAALSGRMTTAEGKLDVINGSETTEGSIAKALADAKADAAAKDTALHNTITQEIGTAKTELEGKIAKKADAKAMEDSLALKADQADLETEAQAREAADTAIKGRLDVIEGEGEGSIKKALADAKKYADDGFVKNGTFVELQNRVGTAEGQITDLENAVGKDGQGKLISVASQIQAVNTAAGELAGRVAQNETDIATIKGDYLKAADKTELQGKIDTAKEQADKGVADAATAKGVADAAKNKIDAFMASAEVGDKAIDTLREIQNYITTDGAAAQKMTADIASKVAQTTYDAKVTELEAADSALGNRATALEGIVGKEAEGDQVATGLVKKVADNAAGIATNKTEIANLKKAVGDVSEVAAKSALDAVSGRVTTVEGKVTNLETAVGTKAVEGGAAATGLYKEIADEATRAQGIESGLRKDVDALKNTVGDAGKGLVKDVDDLQSAVANLQTSNHTHANKAELDKFVAGDKDKLDNAVAKVTGGAEVAGSIAEAKKAADDAQAAADGAKALANGLKLAVAQGTDDKAVVTIKLQNKDSQDQSTIDLPYEFVSDADIKAIIDGLGTQA